MKPLLCLIGLHDVHTGTIYYPDIRASIVTEYATRAGCVRCGKVLVDEAWRWDPQRYTFYAIAPDQSAIYNPQSAISAERP